MGYLTFIEGAIRIDPPVPWGRISHSEFIDRNEYRSVILRVETDTVETDEGTLTRKSAVAIEPWSDDRYKAYSIVEDLQALVDALGAGHSFTGRLNGYGEDNGDMWRLYVRDGKAVQVKVQLVWPDEEADG